MNTTKKLVVLCLAAVMALMAVMPSTFSWYAHNANNNGTGFKVQESLIPISSSSNFSVSTKKSDKLGETSGSNVTKVNFGNASDVIQYYKTTFDNSNGSSDVFADLELKNLLNNSKIRVGVTSPVVNEKGFNITRTPSSNDTTRVYFQPTKKYAGFWYADDVIYLRYYVGSTPTNVHMNKCNGVPSGWKDIYDNSTQAKVFYYDIPNNATSFFFYNSAYYSDSDPNKNWNRTPEFTEINPGTLYRMNGKNITDSYKLVDVVHRDDFVALNSYYGEARMSVGGYVDIGLKNSDEVNSDETPDYYGTGISYSTESATYATVDSNGLVTAVATTDSRTASGSRPAKCVQITATVTGICGDTIDAKTYVYISQYIAQMPVVKNVLVKKGESVDVIWYVLNKTTTTGDLCDKIFYTI